MAENGVAAGVERLTGVVLWGGRSRRMGTDKALLPLDGGWRIIDAVVAALRAGGCDPVLLAGARSAPPDLALPVLADPIAGIGPIAGIAAGLRAAPTPYAFVAACDLPFLRPEVVRLLGGLARGGPGAVAAFGPHGCQPLCAAYGRVLLPLAEAWVESAAPAPRGGLREAAPAAASRSLAEFVREAGMRRVGPEEIRAVDPELVSFTNVNTPEDYERARRAWAAGMAGDRLQAPGAGEGSTMRRS